jgi:diaminopimelate decarboxylase
VGLHGNNKSVEELSYALTAGVGRIIIDSFDEISRLSAVAEELQIRRGSWSEPPPESRRTPTNTSPPPMKIRSSASPSRRLAMEALLACHQHPWLDLIGIHSHIGSQIFDAEGFEVAARRTCGCTPISRLRRALSW